MDRDRADRERADRQSADRGAWAPIARMTNLAEAGYFHDVLAAEDFSCRVIEEGEFHPTTHAWQPAFVLQVQARDHERAVGRLEEELERTGGSAVMTDFAPEMDRDEWAPPRRPAQPRLSLWAPMFIVVAACALAALWIVHGFKPRPAGPAAGNPQLWDALSNLQQPLRSVVAPGGGTYVLRYDRPRQAVVLEEDIDGDGRWDRRQEFRDGHPAVERWRE